MEDKRELEKENNFVVFEMETLADILVYTGMCFGFIISLLLGSIFVSDSLNIILSVCIGVIVGPIVEGFLFSVIIEIYQRIKK